MMNDDKMTIVSELDSMMTKAVDFHGHSCPGLALGVVVSKIVLDSSKRADNEELVAVVENDACGIDAIQVLTGCTFGKGNLIHKDYGKSVYIFYNRNIDKGIRIALKTDVFNSNDSLQRKELSGKIQAGIATDRDIEKHNKLRNELTKSILVAGKKLFNIQEINMEPPMKARKFENIECELCGESIYY